MADLQYREVEQLLEPVPTREGAGVNLKRAIGSRELDMLDPFLLLDHFESENPADYEAGFPMHPHRGIETVTYMISGQVKHRDILGNEGVVGPGAVQWMTAGRAILHEEMPRAPEGGLNGFQLWVNLPARLKMMEPRYQEFGAGEIPQVVDSGATIRVIAGTVADVVGPAKEIAAQPMYLDVALERGGSFTQATEQGHHAFTYVFEGTGRFGVTGTTDGVEVSARRLVVLGDGDQVRVESDQKAVRFLLVAGKPLNEPVARHGPFVMNTRAEILQTLQELRAGTFIKR
jgi:redox-sensitive bicupin YhaK (pirin superfamily)